MLFRFRYRRELSHVKAFRRLVVRDWQRIDGQHRFHRVTQPSEILLLLFRVDRAVRRLAGLGPLPSIGVSPSNVRTDSQNRPFAKTVALPGATSTMLPTGISVRANPYMDATIPPRSMVTTPSHSVTVYP